MAENKIYIEGGNLTLSETPMVKFAGEKSVFVEGGTVFLSGGGATIQGEWDGSTAYTTGQIVAYNNSLYQATADSTGSTPPTNGAGVWIAGEPLIATTLIDADVSDIKLGLLFTVDEDCELTSYNFYKGDATNAGTHVGELWTLAQDGTGTMTEQVTFAGETASGWQTQASVTTPALVVGQTYMHVVRFPVGRYSLVTNAAPTLQAGPVRGRWCYFTNNVAILPDTVVTNGTWMMVTPGVTTAGSADWLQLAKGENSV